MALTYHVLDVFTERPLGGNPLAVVLEADRLSTSEMQAIAREFNLSETVFVLAATIPAHTAKVRIFTPSRELPFAGHPIVGTAVLLGELRMPIVNGERDAIIALEAEVGSVRVGVRLRSGGAGYAEFDAPKLASEPKPMDEMEEIGAALGLIRGEIGLENHKPMLLTGPTTFAYIPVSNLETIAKVAVTPRHWLKAFSDRGIDGVYVYTRQCVRVQSSFHARMLAPDMGVPEDPATGSAAIGLARMVSQFDDLPDGVHRRTVEQGYEIGRPSAIQLVMNVSGGKLTSVRIGGHAVRVAEGRLML
jgi:trans-2,3-dihydro-3-hydroxyanthranilate isomerase